MTKFFRKRVRVFMRRLRKRRLPLTAAAVVAGVGLVGYASYMEKYQSVDPAAYAPLLQLIARAESNGNYNAHFGNANNTSIRFTEMSIEEVQAWQAEFVRQGNPSSAVGRYQIIDTTLSGLVRQLGVDPKQKFDEAMQDRMAIALLERRGALAYVNDKLTREEFAASLAKEWAALPKVVGENPDSSYYAGDGLNQSRVEVNEILGVIETVRIKA